MSFFVVIIYPLVMVPRGMCMVPRRGVDAGDVDPLGRCYTKVSCFDPMTEQMIFRDSAAHLVPGVFCLACYKSSDGTWM